MEYSGLLPAPRCRNTTRSVGRIILILAVIIAVGAAGYYVYKKFLAPSSTPKKDENLEIIVSNPGAHQPKNVDYAGRLMLQPLPYRCPYV